MARARRGAAPYSVQLKRFLSAVEDPSTVFSAATLEREFDPKPNENRRTTINRIHLALRKAWEEGAVVAFVASDGRLLSEDEFCVNGSAAVQHPQIYGLPGADSPDPDYEPTIYTEFLHLKAEGNGRRDSDNATAAATAANAGAVESACDDETEFTDGSDLASGAASEHEAEQTMADEELAELVRRYQVANPAPSWLPDRLLAHIVTLPRAAACWRDGLDKAKGADRLQLIRAGVRRKGPIDTLTATRIVALCRSEREWWSRALLAAIEQYREWDEWIADEDLAALRCAPDEFVLDQDDRYHPVAIVLCGLALDADSEALALVADEAADLLNEEEGQQTLTVQEELRQRAAILEAEAVELRKQLREQEDEAKAQRRRADGLTEELKRGSTAATDAQLVEMQSENRVLLAANADLRSRLEVAAERTQVLEELQARIAQLEQDREELAIRAAVGDHERVLREQVEARLQDQIAETRRLERELQESGGIGNAVEDVADLAKVLARPVGRAAENAARRLAAGSPLPGDPQLLQFASAFGELTASIAGFERTGLSASEAAPPSHVQEAAVDGPSQADVEEHVDDSAVQASDFGAGPVPASLNEPETRGASDEQPPILTRRRSRRSAAFVVHPFGGAGEVGGSAIVVQTRAGHAVLLDAGQRIKGEYGIDAQRPFHYALPPFDQLDAIVISHAHIDHIGSLPVLYREYQRHREDRLPILMSEPTRRLGEIMLRDSAKIQHKREYLTSGAFADLARSDFAPQLDLKPAYTVPDIEESLDAVQILEPRQPRLIPGTSLTVKLLPVAHVLGSCAVHLTDNETGATLLYTGDLGPLTDTQRTLPDFNGVNGFDSADVVIMESTYALPSENDREGRRAREGALQAFYRAARKAADAGGHVLLPAFALGRTQELLRIIEDAAATGELPAGDVYIGGMGEEISALYSQYTGSMWVAPGQMRRASEMNRWVRGSTSFDDAVEDAIGMESFSYFICSPAMLSGGWSRAFLRRMVDEERHAIVFTGYLARHGGGIRNLNQLYTGATIPLEGRDERTTKIKCDWLKAPLSAHAPRGDLLAFAQRMLLGDRRVSFGVLHGVPDAQDSLVAEINQFEGASAQALSNGVPWKPQLG